ncbi:MAG: hypothetical protein FJX25_02320 [Alphaproteobacteria bacterium]|nr:hypothetical protein [Alphaproteobacteria bacterium]
MIDVDANLAECIVKKTGLTDAIITNICNGAVTLVPHTEVEYAFAGVIAFILTGLLVMMVKIWWLE